MCRCNFGAGPREARLLDQPAPALSQKYAPTRGRGQAFRYHIGTVLGFCCCIIAKLFEEEKISLNARCCGRYRVQELKKIY